MKKKRISFILYKIFIIYINYGFTYIYIFEYSKKTELKKKKKF